MNKDQKIQELIPKLNDEFLNTLNEAVKVCGWSVDFIESSQFVSWCYDLVGKEYPDEEPYE